MMYRRLLPKRLNRDARRSEWRARHSDVIHTYHVTAHDWWIVSNNCVVRNDLSALCRAREWSKNAQAHAIPSSRAVIMTYPMSQCVNHIDTCLEPEDLQSYLESTIMAYCVNRTIAHIDLLKYLWCINMFTVQTHVLQIKWFQSMNSANDDAH